jgi:CRP/FNR family cyclic AMP-dependent transcriptional regulator
MAGGDRDRSLARGASASATAPGRVRIDRAPSSLGDATSDPHGVLLRAVSGRGSLFPRVEKETSIAYLIEEGARDDCIHVVLKGVFEVVRNTGVGEPASLGMLRAGELAGERNFIDGTEHQVGLRALADSEVLSLDRADFEKLVPADPDIVYRVMRSIMRAVHARMRRMNLQYIELSNYIFKQHGRY